MVSPCVGLLKRLLLCPRLWALAGSVSRRLPADPDRPDSLQFWVFLCCSQPELPGAPSLETLDKRHKSHSHITHWPHGDIKADWLDVRLFTYRQTWGYLSCSAHGPWESLKRLLHEDSVILSANHSSPPGGCPCRLERGDRLNVKKKKEKKDTLSQFGASELGVNGSDLPGPEVMLSSSSHSGFNRDASHLHRSTYSAEDRPPSAAVSSAFSSSRGPS